LKGARRLRFLATVATLVVVSASALAQTPTFQSVSIQPANTGQIGIEFSRRALIARTSTLVELIEWAHDLRDDETVFGGPDWVRTDTFTIRATTVADATADDMRLMLQTLLEDRFQLQLERGTAIATTYRLVVLDVVSRLKPVTRRNARMAINMDRDEYAGYRWDARTATMGDLAAALSRHLRAPVEDDTRLAGAFDFRFAFSQDVKSEAADPKYGRTIFTALETQVGLKLVADKGPVPGHVIRRAEKPM
jgi:uncharacterized protein (TIGR03435 family)